LGDLRSVKECDKASRVVGEGFTGFEHLPYFKESLLGEGDVDVPKTIRLLEAVGYDGIIHPERLGVAGAGGDPPSRGCELLKEACGGLGGPEGRAFPHHLDELS